MIFLRNSFLFCIFSATAVVLAADLSRTVERYEVEINPQIKLKAMQGSTTLYFTNTVQPSDTLSFPIFDLNIDHVESSGQKLAFSVTNHRLEIKTLKPVKKIKVTYHGTGQPGLVFGESYAYTGYETCSWMICDTFPAPRSKFTIHVKTQKGFTTVTSDPTSAYSNYLFGFATGRFNTYEEMHGSTRLMYVAAKDGREMLQKKFKDTQGMLDFFEEKAGLSYPLKQYTQVLVSDDEAQEKYGFSVIGNPELDHILENPQEDWVIAHELSHQWWGNLITCKDWSHFWLNEGITVFMVAAYKEKKWGVKAYENELALLQKRYQKAIDEKFDVPLTFEGQYPSMKIKRAITYSKAALFMAELRKKMGDQDFWKGFKNYTIKYAGQLVATPQFQAEMQAAHQDDLAALFKKWAY